MSDATITSQWQTNREKKNQKSGSYLRCDPRPVADLVETEFALLISTHAGDLRESSRVLFRAQTSDKIK